MDQTWTDYINITVDTSTVAQGLCARLSGAYRTGVTVHIPKTHDAYAIEAAYVRAVTNDR
jgi:hypothetical protein